MTAKDIENKLNNAFAAAMQNSFGLSRSQDELKKELKKLLPEGNEISDSQVDALLNKFGGMDVATIQCAFVAISNVLINLPKNET